MATTIDDATEARWDDNADVSFVSFSLGPVQSFIEAARSVRDLWTGSYLLSYLTFEAMQPILDRPGGEREFVFPHVEELPLWKLKRWQVSSEGTRPLDRSLLMSCIPNKFIAVVPTDDAKDLADECAKKCRGVWSKIVDGVESFIEERIQRLPDRESWDRALWDAQVGSFFEVRTVVLPWSKAGRDVLNGLVGEVSVDGKLWAPRMKLLAGLLDATRSIRHVPDYFPSGRVPQKCTLLGSFEQMGPAKLSECKDFWREFSKKGPYVGTRIGANERLCAVSLVKRFAWPASLAKRLEVERIERRFPDTATVAAARWLEHTPPLDPENVREDEGHWNGQWLHWNNRDEGQEDREKKVPEAIWETIRAKKRDPEHPVLPTYYAVLMLDGDRMGKWLQGNYTTVDGSRPDGDVIQRLISKALGRFAVEKAPSIVEGKKAVHQGTLVYSGGDDVLAMLPTETVLSCAQELSESYQQNWPKSELHAAEDATVSAGIAVAHYKEDLRYVLQAARQAEKAAKNGGRKALALTICRRSGEHTTAILNWDLVCVLQQLVGFFQEGASDRWAYTLRAELPTLPADAFEAEVHRLIGRLDDADMRKQIGQWADDFLPKYWDTMRERERKKTEREREDVEIHRDFVTLCQSASFLARGRDDR